MKPVDHIELNLRRAPDGFGDRLAEVFDETSPAKRIETAYDGVERMHDTDADAIVAYLRGKVPSRYAELAETMTGAVQQYISDVRARRFPSEEESY